MLVLYPNEKTKTKIQKWKEGLDSIYICKEAEEAGAGNGFIPSTIHMAALRNTNQVESMHPLSHMPFYYNSLVGGIINCTPSEK